MSEHAGTAYLQHIREQLAEQRDRKKSLEQRGQTSVAVSGGLVTLLLAFSDFGVLDPAASTATSNMVTLAIGLLVFGALAGVYVTAPADYDETRVKGMRDWVHDDHWLRPAAKGEQAVADTLLEIIEKAKASNGCKAWWLLGAVALQAVGVLVMAATLIAHL